MRVDLTEEAEQDVIEHYLYGYAHFGERQAIEYEANLRHVLSLIGENPALATERPEYSPPVRVHHTGKHYIIYRVDDNRVLVLRVLREETDISRHL